MNYQAVAFANFPPPFTGQTLCTQYFTEILQAEGFKCIIINTSTSGEKLKTTGKWNTKRFISYLMALNLLSKSWGNNNCQRVLYCCVSNSYLGLLKDALLVYSSSRKAYIIGHVHNGRYHEVFNNPIKAVLANFIRNRISMYIFLSHTLSENCEKINKNKKTIIPNSLVDGRLFSKQNLEIKIKARLVNDTLNILFVGNLLESKGYKDLLLALSILKIKNVRFKANFIGAWVNQRDKKFIEEILLNKGLTKNVRFLGVISDRDKLSSFFAEADVFVLPTYYPIEAQPLTIIEALNHGTPVISTRHASIPDYIKDGFNGYLINKRDHVEIANAIIKITEKKVWSVMAKNAHQTFLEKFHPDKARNKILKLINKITKN